MLMTRDPLVRILDLPKSGPSCWDQSLPLEGPVHIWGSAEELLRCLRLQTCDGTWG